MLQVEDIYVKIINSVPGLKTRPSQLKMVQIIDDCLQHLPLDSSMAATDATCGTTVTCGTEASNANFKHGANICLIEAPTGTGKSMAYLTAAVTNALSKNKKLVISTATKTLQNQLVEKDIPQFIKYSDVEFSYGLAKGRGNYLCPYQLDLVLKGEVGDLLNGDLTNDKSLLSLKTHFTENKWEGDLDNAPIPLTPKLKQLVTIDRDSCLNNLCPYNQKDDGCCPYFINRDKLKKCDVVVVNHSLLLADIKLGGGCVLPFEPTKYILCIDETHVFSDVAVDSFMSHFDLKNTIKICHNLINLLHSLQLYQLADPLYASTVEKTIGLVGELVAELERLLLLLTQNQQFFIKKDQLILNDYLDRAVVLFKDVFVNCAFITGELNNHLNYIHNALKNNVKDNPSDITAGVSLTKIGFYCQIVEAVLLTSQYMLNEDDSRYNANVRWVELKVKHAEEEFTINAGLTHVGNILCHKLWSRALAIIMTSATLAVGRNFNYYIHKLGLNTYSTQLTAVSLETAFDYSSQAQLVVPRFTSSPDYLNIKEFIVELSRYLNKVLSYTDAFGTLVLFFSRTQLHEVYRSLDVGLRERILLQDDYVSNMLLINEHKRKIDSGIPSIIFGLSAFAEGVDLPALYCMHVIITKLPFETHDTPISLVQRYWLEYEKGNYFAEIALPETCIKLVQAVGRLIRSDRDYGQVSICDNRIVTKNYGKTLLDTLPQFNRRYDRSFIDRAYQQLKKS